MGNLYVITGGPCCGKSSVINELAVRGYFTVPDCARVFVNRKASHGHDKDVVWDEYAVGTEAIHLDRKAEQNVPDGVTAILDYSLACNIAYHRVFDGHERYLPDDIYDVTADRYEEVFHFERLPYEQDDVRKEDDEHAQKVHEELERVYDELGYDVIDVPVIPIDDRADFVESFIEP